jgi:hypothetical protein
MLGVGQTNQHHSFAALAGCLSRSSTAGSSRTSTRSARRLVNHVVRVTACTPTAGTTKRTFFGNSSYGHYRTYHHLPEPEEFVTPMETILMDCTAWFVAFALIYTPSTLHHEDDDNETDHDNNNKSQSKEAHRERRRRQERNESRGSTNRQHQKDDSVDN